jgi:hypothetical protein
MKKLRLKEPEIEETDHSVIVHSLENGSLSPFSLTGFGFIPSSCEVAALSPPSW